LKYLILAFLCTSLWAKEVDTNSVYMGDAPAWVTRPRVEKIIDHIQMVLEWSIHKIQVHFYTDQAAFQRASGMGGSIIAASLRKDNSIHLGPRVDSTNFDQVFGHELVHVISYQKYKDAIPSWLEEGLANYLSKNGKVDYPWLASHGFPADVRSFTHPGQGNADEIHYHYVTSQALIEMIAAKCDLSNLLRLSVERKMEDYLKTYCEIPDLNEAFHKWVKSKAGKS